MHKVENLGPLAEFWEMEEAIEAMISTGAHCTYVSGYSDNGRTEDFSGDYPRQMQTWKLSPWLKLIAKILGRSHSAMQPCSPAVLELGGFDARSDTMPHVVFPGCRQSSSRT
ncbi:hypothetical protein N7481_003549 [Penicillium waksmanii]|uniref:uncharacterized protein n=1 Tax=Penicillium waksmanii TaxID=69791 RepID=UPI0025467CDC|nr:uncharacterized protein N7481_003549 [Penicillium waksmanii]KAJ5988339.1 hypothetical protein N7481_003549 [Penicillium waksmanii]